MTSPSSAPKLPLWVFIVAYVVLLATAGIMVRTGRPYSEVMTLAIVACVIGGTAVLLIPIIARYERQKNETLDDRQRALEALSRTVAASAEQISIAANGLHEIAELAQRNLRHAEQLPHKLQEKMAEFQAQLANANDTEKEELEKELEELRASETERLQSTSDKIARAVSELTKLEAATQHHLAAANDALSKLALGTANAIGKAQAAAEQALTQARKEAARGVGEATGEAVKSIEAAKTAALAEVSAQFDANLARIKQATQELAGTIEQLKTAGATAPVAPPPALPPPPDTPVPTSIEQGIAAAEFAAAGSPASAAPLASPPKRPRKPRREDPTAPAEPTVPAEPSPTGTEPAAENAAEPPPPPSAAATPPEAPSSVADEPAPIAPETIAEVAPLAPKTTDPFPAPESPPTEAASEGKPIRKRSGRREDPDQAGLGLSLGETLNGDTGESGAASSVVESVLSSDGATRLIVTAYIGIGNRLFIRGAGPGLSWEKGVPLQFVSIGKWRWETNEANAPVQFKLFKNDEHECAGLGAVTIEPGHQQEVSASFA